jgi:hypothetical protein
MIIDMFTLFFSKKKNNLLLLLLGILAPECMFVFEIIREKKEK